MRRRLGSNWGWNGFRCRPDATWSAAERHCSKRRIRQLKVDLDDPDVRPAQPRFGRTNRVERTSPIAEVPPTSLIQLGHAKRGGAAQVLLELGCLGIRQASLRLGELRL